MTFDAAALRAMARGLLDLQDRSPLDIHDVVDVLERAHAAGVAEGEAKHVEHHRCERCYQAGVAEGRKLEHDEYLRQAVDR